MSRSGADLPAVIGGKYRVVRELGRGGMGVLYVVEHQGTGEELALKLMSDRLLSSPQAVERFKREARAPTRVKSEHVVRVIDADTAPELGGAPFLVMELLEGDDLEQAAASSPPSPKTVADWLRQAGRALDRAHALGFVHRDLKPANLFLAQRTEGPPIVKLLDFGIVKVLEETGATDTGATIGTPRYMSPEQVFGERGAVGRATDVWAMGLVAFRLISGNDYWRAGATIPLIAEILHGEMPPPSERGCDLGPAFDAWFLRSCARDPAARFASVGEQMTALVEAVSGKDAPPRSGRPSSDELAHASTIAHGATPQEATPAAADRSSRSTGGAEAPVATASPEPSVAALASAVLPPMMPRLRTRVLATGAALGLVALAWWQVGSAPDAPSTTDSAAALRSPAGSTIEGAPPMPANASATRPAAAAIAPTISAIPSATASAPAPASASAPASSSARPRGPAPPRPSARPAAPPPGPTAPRPDPLADPL